MLETIGVLWVLTMSVTVLALLQYRRSEMYAEAKWLVTLIYLAPAAMSLLCWGAISSYLPLAIFELLFRLIKSACLLSFSAYLNRLLGREPTSPFPEYSKSHMEIALAKAGHVQPLPPFCFLRPLPLRNLDEVQVFTIQAWLGILQFIVISPMLLLTGILLRYVPSQDLLMYGEARTDGTWLYICIGSTASGLLAAYWILLYTQAVERVPNCKDFNVLHQSIWIIGVVVVTEVQKLVIVLLARGNVVASTADYSEAYITEQLTDILCCGEMLIAAVTVSRLFRPISPRD